MPLVAMLLIAQATVIPPLIVEPTSPPPPIVRTVPPAPPLKTVRKTGGPKVVYAPEEPGTASEQPQGTSCLSPSVAQGARILAVGTYEGGLPVARLATHEGHEVKAVAIHVPARGGPLVVVLSAYDPVVWDLRDVPKNRLRAVFVSGYHAQAVAGAGSRPVRVTTYLKPNKACGEAAYAYKGGKSLDRLDALVRRVFRRGIDGFTSGYTLKHVLLEGAHMPSQVQSLVSPDSAVGASEFSSGTNVDGPFGLQRLLDEGAIRKATRADVAELDRVLTRKSPTGRLAPVHASIATSEAYVVLRPITMPTGMYGAHSATFLIPRGVPMPKDSGSHNRYWMMATGECLGPACPSD